MNTDFIIANLINIVKEAKEIRKHNPKFLFWYPKYNEHDRCVCNRADMIVQFVDGLCADGSVVSGISAGKYKRDRSLEDYDKTVTRLKYIEVVISGWEELAEHGFYAKNRCQYRVRVNNTIIDLKRIFHITRCEECEDDHARDN